MQAIVRSAEIDFAKQRPLGAGSKRDRARLKDRNDMTENWITRRQPQRMMTRQGMEKKHEKAIHSYRDGDAPSGRFPHVESGSGDNDRCGKSGTSHEEPHTH